MKRALTVLIAGLITGSVFADEPAKAVIDRFYKSYLGQPDATKSKQPPLAFSRSFQDLIREDTKVCKAKAGTDSCGWGADGDVYLNAQEVDPALTYENSRISITEPKPGSVEVKLNVYPSSKEAGAAYDRTITFLMIREKDQCVVDDIVYGKDSSRKNIQKEIASYIHK